MERLFENIWDFLAVPKKAPLHSKRSAKKTGGPRDLTFFVKVPIGALHVCEFFENFWGLFKNFWGQKGVPEKVPKPEILCLLEFPGNKNLRKFLKIFWGGSKRGVTHTKRPYCMKL